MIAAMIAGRATERIAERVAERVTAKAGSRTRRAGALRASPSSVALLGLSLRVSRSDLDGTPRRPLPH